MKELEDASRNLSANYEKEMLEHSKHVDGLRFEIKELQVQQLEQQEVQTKLEHALTEAKVEIEDLNEVNKNQELELLDNAEELEQFEGEIGAMQQFIRDRSKLNFFIFLFEIKLILVFMY
jgi:predicted RNase H-like nuclease (RuvC/YqgF family)